VHNLSTDEKNAIFYLSSHSGVIYDYEYRRQTILQGHCNVISCCVVSSDKRWIVTADKGADSILVVWDSYSGTPVKSIFTPHQNGCTSVDISNDSLYVVTLSTPNPVRKKKSRITYIKLVVTTFILGTSARDSCLGVDKRRDGSSSDV